MDTVFMQDKIIGHVTSGAFSPTCKKAIGMALINVNNNTNSKNLTIKIHGNFRQIKVINKQFYIRQKIKS
jgi:glycine cleavage system aminomethyltransferase T